jgi:kynurenine 3-monooxygenase
MASFKPILIVGAGLAGCLMAIEVARLGYRVVVIEKRGPNQDRAARRSINLALASSTLRLLSQTEGIGSELEKLVTPLQGRVLHPLAGGPTFQSYAENPSQSTLLNPSLGTVSISRSNLNFLLRAIAARNSSIEFRFGWRLIDCDAEQAELKTQDSFGNTCRYAGEAIIAADGAGSAVRHVLTHSKKGKIREDRTRLKHAYKELVFPTNRSLRRPALHLWPRAGFLMMALPNVDGIFRGAIFLPCSGQNSFAALKSAGATRRFCEKQFPDITPDANELAAQFASNPMSTLTSIRCVPWHVDRVILIGDACHTLYPFSGQGANLALEDCFALRRHIEEFAPDWPKVFSAFTASRKPKIDYLCEATRALSPLILSALPQLGILGCV